VTLRYILTKLNTEALISEIERGDAMESRMLKAAFGDIDIVGMPAVELYRLHFALFHKLYSLQNEYCEKGRYLHVHFMKTELFDYPKKGKCAYFEDSVKGFCREDIQENSSHCEHHTEILGDEALESLSLKYFYLDAENYKKLDSVTAESLLSGAWEILSGKDSLEDAYLKLGLRGYENDKTVKLRFRELCKIEHPDYGGCRERFIDINRAYRLITRWQKSSEAIS